MSKIFGKGGRRSQKSRGNVEVRLPLPRVLIVCEGAKTEPGYFREFRIHPQVRQLDIRGEGMNTEALVKESEKIDRKDGPFDEVWCVFDRDSFPPDNYDNAIYKIESKKKYHVAYSNEAFELWFVLHFEFLDAAISRAQYIDKLTSLLGRKYQKNDREVYRLLRQNGETQAIQRAEQLLNRYAPEIPNSQRCPCTTVHLLVERLRKWEKEAKP